MRTQAALYYKIAYGTRVKKVSLRRFSKYADNISSGEFQYFSQTFYRILNFFILNRFKQLNTFNNSFWK